MPAILIFDFFNITLISLWLFLDWWDLVLLTNQRLLLSNLLNIGKDPALIEERLRR